ncbi:Glucokinase [Planctomycetes bacterium Pan216]|uniref:Glucokinase n=1 Tax=Kolteria novifilia TaxID=2527975 RepID=A0A518B275_9BACT|nr:Glucokinase [Planctomycetes bacterium Pan216]
MAGEAIRPFYLGIDIRGASAHAGVVDDTGKAIGSVANPTHAERGSEQGVLQICRTAREAVMASALTLDDIEAVGICCRGPLDLTEQILLSPPNLPGWLNLPLPQLVGEQLGVRAVLQNDANAVAFAEHWVGAGQGANSLALFTLGSSIGCGILLRGQLLEGAHSHAGEAGHLRIALEQPRRNTTGLFGSLEAYASATAMVDRTREALVAGESSELLDATDRGEKLTAAFIFERATAGDALCERIVDETAFYLAVGAVNVMHLVDPEVVLFSGAMTDAGPGFLEKIRSCVRENALPILADATRIDYASLGSDAGFIGAAGCARKIFATSPS